VFVTDRPVKTMTSVVKRGLDMPKLTAIRKQALDELMRQAIFDAAVAVLSEHGVEGMTMDRVALAADVAKGSLYHYFSGKQALLELVYSKVIDPIVHNTEEIVAMDRPAIEKLANHLDYLLEHVAKHAKVFQLLFDDDTAQGLLLSTDRQTRKVGSQRLAEVFRQGIAEGVFEPADPLLLTHMFLGLCRGVFDSKPDLERREQRERVQRSIMNAFLNGIATEKCRRG
jgi:AcrR family transcriptional regulator